MTSQDLFDTAVEQVKVLNQRPEKAEMINLYGLYKQATVGDVNIERPGMLDFMGKGKWDAWHSKKGITTGEAMDLYIQLVEALKGKYGMVQS